MDTTAAVSFSCGRCCRTTKPPYHQHHTRMVAYEPVLHVKAERELNTLPQEDKDRLTSLLKDIAGYESPTQHSKVRHLEGHDHLFRVRAGGVRAICKLQKPNLLILKVGERENVYEGIDDIDQRLKSPVA